MLRRFMLIPLLLAPLAACGQAADTTVRPTTAGAPSSAAAATKAPSAGTTGATSGSGSARPSAAAVSAGALSGTQHAFLKGADPAKNTITFDLVDWFEGAKAVAACKEDGVTETDNDWCTGYYYRNNSHKLRTLPLKPGAKLRVVDMGGPVTLVPADLAKFRDSLKANGGLFVFDVAGGAVVKADQVYTP